MKHANTWLLSAILVVVILIGIGQFILLTNQDTPPAYVQPHFHDENDPAMQLGVGDAMDSLLEDVVFIFTPEERQMLRETLDQYEKDDLRSLSKPSSP